MVASPREAIEASDLVIVSKKSPQIQEAILQFKNGKNAD